jgi:iron complex transport system ATP-binding protein
MTRVAVRSGSARTGGSRTGGACTGGSRTGGACIYEIDDLVYRYPSGASDVLRGVSLTLAEGEALTVLGPNGAGKSTLLDCMAGLAAPTSGTVRLAGRDMREMKPHEIARICGYVPQNHTPAFSYTVLDYVLMGRAPHLGAFSRPGAEDEAAAREILGDLGILHLADKPYTEISGGERQQAVIARVVCQAPRVILFDEPTSHLDCGNQHRILELIRRFSDRGFAAVFTTHDPDHALLLGGRAAVLGRDGRLATGLAEELVTQERMRELYRVDMEVAYMEEAGRVCCLAPKL